MSNPTRTDRPRTMVMARLRAALLALAVAVPTNMPLPVMAPAIPLGGLAVLAGGASVLDAEPAEARSRSGSGSRSSSSSSSLSSSRTPSYSSSNGSSSSSSSSSSGGWFGGYSRTPSTGRSAGDKAMSRENSARALNDYRADKAPPATTPTSNSTPPPTTTSSSSRATDAGSRDWSRDYDSNRSRDRVIRDRTPSAEPPRRLSYQWNNSAGWRPPAYAAPYMGRSFGIWDAAMLWFLFSTLNQPSHAAFFHDNAGDPGYREWRAEADRIAATDPEVKTQLAKLDVEMNAMEARGVAREPGRLPDDLQSDVVPPDDQSAADDDGGFFVTMASLFVLAVFGLMLFGAWRVIRALLGFARGEGAAEDRRGGKPPPPSRPMTLRPGTDFNNTDQSASDRGGDAMARHGEKSPFRLGQTVALDPSAFLLAGDAVKVSLPDDVGADGLTSAQSVAVLTSRSDTLHRLYVADDCYLQIHLDSTGRPDECRFFRVLDELEPADKAEWGEWLDEGNGMLGLPEFRTPDGTAYLRAWASGTKRVEPIAFSETMESTDGYETGDYRMMLYRRDTGLKDPAPEVEYLLVSVIESGGEAWIEVATGIDVNPASLGLT